MLNTAKLAGIHYFLCQPTTDSKTQTLLTETINNTKFIEVTSEIDTGSSKKDSE